VLIRTRLAVGITIAVDGAHPHGEYKAKQTPLYYGQSEKAMPQAKQ
jgi:hypothetical protein